MYIMTNETVAADRAELYDIESIRNTIEILCKMVKSKRILNIVRLILEKQYDNEN